MVLYAEDKSYKLLQYLVRLVTPKGGTVLDPFNGSDGTGKFVMRVFANLNLGGSSNGCT